VLRARFRSPIRCSSRKRRTQGPRRVVSRMIVSSPGVALET
jgi:hypothetical protein